MEYLELGINILPWVVAIASAIAAITPGDTDNRIVHHLRTVSDFLAINVGKAKPGHVVLAEQAKTGWTPTGGRAASRRSKRGRK